MSGTERDKGSSEGRRFNSVPRPIPEIGCGAPQSRSGEDGQLSDLASPKPRHLKGHEEWLKGTGMYSVFMDKSYVAEDAFQPCFGYCAFNLVPKGTRMFVERGSGCEICEKCRSRWEKGVLRRRNFGSNDEKVLFTNRSVRRRKTAK